MSVSICSLREEHLTLARGVYCSVSADSDGVCCLSTWCVSIGTISVPSHKPLPGPLVPMDDVSEGLESISVCVCYLLLTVHFCYWASLIFL